ncbi:ergothioneine biosynthesis protein EgtB [Caenimonas sedimenti]|uniref:Ergothioneine biosynthesis protein EgtB n=1 Tax=Caenimonas sedimenti TaxID=2596921 RepID=A0A562ZI99_9BURK|nr:selenoneine synthase SenA [Caenimonas sedimenti]TWO68035.1 ergothioneine biosynthesis protein EgtB [Caenimonas sedimenti]
MDTAFSGYSVAQALRNGGREPVREALLAARQRTLVQADAFATALESSSMCVPYDATLNPPLWELGHIAWFQEYWIARNRERSRGLLCDPDHVRAASLLPQADAWYDSSQVAHRSRWELPLPSAGATRAYLASTLAQTLELLDRLPIDAADSELYFFRLVALHEEMHAEAGAYMARTLGIALPMPVQSKARASGETALAVPGQVFRLGYDGPGFAFDNELGAHDVVINAFEIDAAPVSWSRFQSFIDAGGYEQPRWWSDDGWRWLQQARLTPPAGSTTATDAPALHLSAHEAEAWCRWAGRRLPTEAEWECAALSARGFLWGKAWEWTATPFQAYPGFVPHPYRDYSAPWFGSRRVLRGACEATAASLAHPRYRNFFEPHRNDIFAGFRSCS